MKLGSFCTIAASLLLAAAAFAAPPEKVIHLRNEQITTPTPSRNQAQQADRAAANGLWVIQFESTPTTEQRAELAALGVDLLSYVPEDSFIASFDHVPPGQLRNLPFVRWVGPFKAEHKLQGKISKASPAQELQVSVLLAPRSKPNDAANARSQFTRITGQSDLRQGTILRGSLPASRIQQLAESPAVLWVEPAPQMKLNDEIATKIVAGDDGNMGTFAAVHQLGYTGAGVTVSVADSGLDSGDTNSMHPDIAGRVTALFSYGSPADPADYHSHGTHCAGIIGGNGTVGETDENGYLYGVGVAPAVNLIGQRIFDGLGGFTYTNANFEPLTRDAKQAGADIGSNSWGDDTQGRYDLSAMEYDALVRDADTGTSGDQPYILEFSAGNAGPGPQTIGSPAVAKNVIATGASQNDRLDFFIYADGQDTMADFSSRGPCEDGRIKPDIVAPGTWIASLRSMYANDDNAWLTISGNYMYQGGTSQAGPHAAGAAALFVQYYRSNYFGVTPSPALVKAALINSAVDMDESFGTAAIPNNDEGWGRIDLTELIGSPRDYDFVNQSTLLTNGAIFERRVVIADNSEPFRVTLAYTDVPALPAAIPALVNNLDLEVLAPDGRLYRGNQFLNGESVANAPTPDSINNVEGVALADPLPGEYVIRVRGSHVVQDARGDTGAVDQDFALVTSAKFLPPGTGLVYLNQRFYTVPATVKVTVVDTDQAGQPSVAATLASDSQTNALPLTLFPVGSSGVFTGSVATALTPVVADGSLHIAHNDLITASYFDTSASITRTGVAQADLVPPIISAVASTNIFGSVFISWTTDEPATSLVRFGTNTLTLVSTNLSLVTAHSIKLSGLQSGATYFFEVVSADEAGNVSTNNNSGSNYSFVVVTPPPLLLVNAYTPFTASGDDSPEIPLSAYTNALNQTGISYEIWNTGGTNLPTLNTLQSYRVVLWRLNDSLYGGLLGYQGLSGTERSLLTGYVTNGGALCLTSMELLSRMGTGASALSFSSNILHVASFNEDNGGSGIDDAIGYAADPVSSGMQLSLDYSNYYSPSLDILFGQSPNVSDTVVPTPDAQPVFLDDASSLVCGVRFPKTGQDSVGRVVFLSFPLDTVPETGTPPNTRANLLLNSLTFLAPGLSGIGTVTLDKSAYPVPGLVTIEVGDSDLTGSGSLTVNVYSDSQTNGIVATLNETVLPGLFRGFVTLVSTTNTPTSGQLKAANGDSLGVDYLDASAGSIISAFATVDTIFPLITNIAAVPRYQSCTVTWNTSENSDALVQFWEGDPAFNINRTAFVSTPATSHSVPLDRLKANQDYYYQVVSRDIAGNATVDNNSGNYYIFHTLEPLHPPFFDDMETASTLTNWHVTFYEQYSEFSESDWTLGTPNTSTATNAFSGTNCWGSVLDGGNPAIVITSLEGPVIDLSGGTTATLTFWHNHDFTDVYDAGELDLVINDTGEEIPLEFYYESSGGWVQETVDLTPYLGKVVYLIWSHVLISGENIPRAGWLLDDVSITLSNATTGTIIVSNNLWQADFALDGMPQSGLTLVDANATPGTHTVTYNAVPFYNTPPAQTNTLTAGGTNLFIGNYTFTDINSNGISDAWEQSQFGEVSTNRTASTDTDGDGMTDGDEAIAGTDPSSTNSYLSLTASMEVGGALRFDWNAVSGRAYRLNSTTNLNTWTLLSGWLHNSNSYILPATNSGPNLFQLEVAP